MGEKLVRQTPLLMGKKRGMTQVFDESGEPVPCTVISVDPNVITQIKTKATDGYTAVQLAFDEIKVKDARTIENRCTKPLIGHFKKAKVAPARHLFEIRLNDVSEYAVGQSLNIKLFQNVEFVDIKGFSKGRGYQGVMRLYHFRGGPASHGSGFHRHAGSTGMRSTPGRCLLGGKRAHHMGDENVTMQNLRVLAVDEENNLLFVKGAVPGTRDGVVIIGQAKKKVAKTKKQEK